MRPLLLAVALVLFGMGMVFPSGSQADSPDARAIVQKGTVEAGLAAGYLQGLDVLTSDSANRSAVYVLPRIGKVLTSEIGKGWYMGNLELLLEPLYAHYYKPFDAEAAGGSFLFKYNFLSYGRWMPYWDLGLGMLWTNLAPRIQEQSTQFNFVLESGPGVDYFVTQDVAFMIGTRFHHISNAGLGDRNHGLNSILGYVGVSVFLP